MTAELHVSKQSRAARDDVILNAVCNRGMTPLMNAVRRGCAGSVKLLLEYKAEINQRTDRATALVCAIQCRSSDMVTLLLERNADPNLEVPKRTAVYGTAADGRSLVTTLSPSETPLRLAAKLGAVADIRSLLDSKADMEAIDDWGQTALTHAAKNGHMAAVALLVERKANTTVRTGQEHPQSGKTLVEYIEWLTLPASKSILKLLTRPPPVAPPAPNPTVPKDVTSASVAADIRVCEPDG